MCIEYGDIKNIFFYLRKLDRIIHTLMFHWRKYHNGQPAQTSCVNLVIEALKPPVLLCSHRPETKRVHQRKCLFRLDFSAGASLVYLAHRMTVAPKIYIMQQNCMNIVKFPRLVVMVRFITSRKDYNILFSLLVNHGNPIIFLFRSAVSFHNSRQKYIIVGQIKCSITGSSKSSFRIPSQNWPKYKRVCRDVFQC